MRPLKRLGDVPVVGITAPRRARVERAADPETRVSLVLPAYRAGDRIDYVIDRLARYLERRPWGGEVVVVDDASQDDTAAVAAGRQGALGRLTVLRHGRRCGLGAAARTGVLVARGRFVVLCDVDTACPVSNLDQILEKLAGGAHVAVSSRRAALPGVEEEPLLQRLSDTAFRALARRVVPLDVQDIRGGFKGFHRLVAQKIALRSRLDGVNFDVEWLAMAKRFGYHVVETPINPAEFRAGPNTVRGATPGTLRDLWRIRRHLESAAYDTPCRQRSPLEDTSFVRMQPGLLPASEPPRVA